MVTDKIKALIKESGHSMTELAEFYGVKPQSIWNKFNRSSFSAGDLIKIAEFTGSKLYFERDGKKIELTADDLREGIDLPKEK